MRLSVVVTLGSIMTALALCRSAMATNIEYATVTPGDGNIWYNAVEETMWVPPLPATPGSGEQIAVWFGLGDRNSTVIQPLLQYGATAPPPRGNLNYWIVVNEMDVTGNAPAVRRGIAVNPGDRIDGVVEVDTGGSCLDYTQGTGCGWWCGFSINGGNWFWDYFVPPQTSVFNTITVGSLEVQTTWYQCDWLPAADTGHGILFGEAGVDFLVAGAWEPGPSWNQFRSVTAEQFQPMSGLTQYPTSNFTHCHGNWYTSGHDFTLLWTPNANPGQWYSN
jgi:hypothetical protein